VVFDGERVWWLNGERVPTGDTHGSGCAFSAAVAAGLARGLDVHDALGEAKAFIAGAIRHALAIGHGHGPVNPMWRVVP
ncbi:MAG TPA: bifunctional hydroxymethylpyrimidine kinase/phosphomethylpyrimidine kinase, partial [Candidatus Dormibacteraeota bacterium]